MLDSQGGKCVTCGEDIRGVDADGRERARIDHDHARELVLGKRVVRGLLCQRCNIILGFLESLIPMMPQMLEYLEETNAEPSGAVLENVGRLQAHAARYLASNGDRGGAV